MTFFFVVRENLGTIFFILLSGKPACIYPAGFLPKVTPKYTFRRIAFFRPKNRISKVAIIKTKSATIAFVCPLLLSSSSLFLFLLFFFYFAGVFFELIGHKKPAFWPFFTQMAASFVNRFVF